MEEQRWVDKRSQYLSTNKIGFREKVARAVAYSELGYSASGIAGEMDTTEGTVRKYLDNASNAFPGITAVTAVDLDYDPQAPVEELPDMPPSECPACLNESLVSGPMVDVVFSTSGWGSPSMAEDAELACYVCRVVRLDGEWQRAETLNSRAYSLAEASSSKTASDYREQLTAGIDPSDQNRKDRGVEDADGW